MKFNKLTIALTCLLSVPAVFAAPGDPKESTFGKAKDFVSKKFNSGLSTLNNGRKSATEFVTGHPKTSITVGLGAAALGGAYYKYSDKINAKVKAALKRVKKAAIAAKKRFSGLSTKQKVGVVVGGLAAVAVPVLAYIGAKQYGKIKPIC